MRTGGRLLNNSTLPLSRPTAPTLSTLIKNAAPRRAQLAPRVASLRLSPRPAASFDKHCEKAKDRIRYQSPTLLFPRRHVLPPFLTKRGMNIHALAPLSCGIGRRWRSTDKPELGAIPWIGHRLASSSRFPLKFAYVRRHRRGT